MLALRNLDAILAAAGASLATLVKTTIFYTNIDDFATINAIYARFMPELPPARSAPANVVLPHGLLISIDAIAVLPPAQSCHERGPDSHADDPDGTRRSLCSAQHWPHPGSVAGALRRAACCIHMIPITQGKPKQLARGSLLPACRLVGHVAGCAMPALE